MCCGDLVFSVEPLVGKYPANRAKAEKVSGSPKTNFWVDSDTEVCHKTYVVMFVAEVLVVSFSGRRGRLQGWVVLCVVFEVVPGVEMIRKGGVERLMQTFGSIESLSQNMSTCYHKTYVVVLLLRSVLCL